MAQRLRPFLESFVRHVWLILAREAPSPRLGLLRAYLELKAKQGLAFKRPQVRYRRAEILGSPVYFYDDVSLTIMFEDIFVREDYAFSARSPEPFIVDCGSNIGLGVLFFKRRYPGAAVLAFEPDEDAFRALTDNVAANSLEGVRVEKKAVAGTPGVTALGYDPRRPASLVASTRQGRAGRARREVEAVALSAYVDRPVDFLKLDVEGTEEAVLQELAAADKLRLIRELVVEYHHHVTPSDDRLSRVLTLLEESGFTYRLEVPGSGNHDVGAYQDILIHARRREG